MKAQLVAKPGWLRPDIVQVLNDLDRRCFPGASLYPKQGCYWWVAYQDGMPLAFAGLKELGGVNEGIGFLCRAGVLREARGQGLQKRLIKLRLKMAAAIRLQEVVTYVAKHNFPSLVSLIKTGFLLYKPLEEYGLPGAHYLRKPL